MSIIETLTEGIVNRDMKKEGSALLSKWGKTGLLEGLQTEHEKASMARLLENQAKELLREANTMQGGDVEGFAAVAFPIVRRVFAGLIANQLVSVQPMSLPSGLIFFLDFTFGETLNDTDASPRTRLGNSSANSIYGGDKVGKNIIDGVNLAGSTNKEGFSGPLRDGAVGYAYASPTGSLATIPAHAEMKELSFDLDGAVTQANAKIIKYDPDLLSVTDSSLGVIVVEVDEDAIDPSGGDADYDNMSAFILNVTAAAALTSIGAISNFKQLRRLTQRIAAADSASTKKAVRFVFSTTETLTAQAFGNVADKIAVGDLVVPLKDTVVASSAPAGAIDAYKLPLEANANIPEIDIKVDSTAITAQTKKLKAKWSPELGQDLNAYHNLDAEVELTSILSEQIALEIDREILADLVNGATAGTYYWSRSPGLFVNKTTGGELGANSAAPDFTGTVSEWYETLIETINDVSAQIHRKTLRGGANFVIVSPEVANILEFTSGFRANVTADADKGDIGAVKVGSLMWFHDADEHTERDPAYQLRALRTMAETSDGWGWMFRFRNHIRNAPVSMSECLRMTRLDDGRVMRMTARVHEGFDAATRELHRRGIHPMFRYAPFTCEHYGLSVDEDALAAKLAKYRRLLVLELNDNQHNSSAWVSLGLQFVNDGNLDKAQECYERGVACAGDSYLPFKELGIHHLRIARAMLAESATRTTDGHPWQMTVGRLLEQTEPFGEQSKVGNVQLPDVDLPAFALPDDVLAGMFADGILPALDVSGDPTPDPVADDAGESNTGPANTNDAAAPLV